jgi:hypothetical protein
MKKYHNIEKIIFEGENLILKVDGKKHTFKISKISDKLAKALQIEKEEYEISPSGYGIHWRLIDEDLSIDGLLGIKHKPIKKREKILA